MHDEVFFLRRARPGLVDLWTEAVDWAPTILTTVAALLTPYLFMCLLEAGRPGVLSGQLLVWLARDRYVRTVVALGLAALAGLWLWQTVQLVLERARVVRLDLHELECWPNRTRRHLLVRDIVGVLVGRTEARSRWWVLRAPRQTLILFIRRPGELAVDRVQFDWSRHELGTNGAALPELTSGADGNRIAADVIALVRRRRTTLGLPVQELPEDELDITAASGVRLVGNRDQMVLHTATREIPIPGWAVRSATVIAAEEKAKTPLQLALELDPRCGEFHLLVGIGHGPGDQKMVDWCQLLAARFDKDVGPPRSRT